MGANEVQLNTRMQHAITDDGTMNERQDAHMASGEHYPRVDERSTTKVFAGVGRNTQRSDVPEPGWGGGGSRESESSGAPQRAEHMSHERPIVILFFASPGSLAKLACPSPHRGR